MNFEELQRRRLMAHLANKPQAPAPGVAPAAAQERRPVFTAEGPTYYQRAYAIYSPFARPGDYRTHLSPQGERDFRTFVSLNDVPFNPNAKVADYDLRGWWKANGRPTAAGAYTPGTHFTDRWKTPYDTTFSAESRYATSDNPFQWRGDRLIDTRNGRVMFAAGS